MHRWIGLLLTAALLTGCGVSANVDQDRETITRLDREWSASTKDINKFLSYYAPDASVYPPGMPIATGSGPIREVMTAMSSAPGFTLEFAPTKAVVSASGDIGYTTGNYQASMGGVPEKGKYVAVWKKQPDGSWKVVEDIFNADSGPAPAPHVMVQPNAITWGDAPPSLPAGTKMAVISGDPAKAGPFVVRAQLPAGYKVPPHWHPADENVTVLSGTIAMGMGDAFDESKMQSFAAGGYIGIPGEQRHYLLSKTAATIQVHGTGPFVLNYVNPSDDPSKKK